MRPIALVLIVGTLLGVGGCQTAQTGSHARIYDGLGPHHRQVTTTSPEAQKYFNQGLIFTFAFNHDEAIRSYQEAARLDPNMAMAWWGIALCNGPHINNAEMDEAHSKAAWDALQKAIALKDKVSPPERELIAALKARYADPAAGKLPLTQTERASLDKAYSDEMKKVYTRFRFDADIGVLYAESLMDLRPWDLWDQDGKPRPETPEITKVLEKVLEITPQHPGANHLYIHAVEASLNPEKAVPSAERLGQIAPSAGHLVHMPAHIYARVGRWDDAAKSNRAAIAADATYRKASPDQGFYHIYMAHNRGFLSFGCMMQGRSEEAIKSAREMVAAIPAGFIEQMAPVIDGYLPITLEALMRFGKWEEILREPKPAENLPICIALWHGCRAIAYANTGKMAEADQERTLYHQSAAAVPKDRKVGNSPSTSVLKLAGLVVDGEIAYKRGSIDEGVKLLREAAVIEDTLNYNEPPDWMVPARHALGAILLAEGRAEEAEAVYREDLKNWPENGWSLYGLAKATEKRNPTESAAAMERFRKAWANADIKIGSSCLCVPKAD